MAQFKRVVSTPNILTEVSNLANKVTDADKELFHAIFAKVITEVIKTEEYVDSASVANGQPDTWKLGLADAVATKVCMTQEGIVAINRFAIGWARSKDGCRRIKLQPPPTFSRLCPSLIPDVILNPVVEPFMRALKSAFNFVVFDTRRGRQ